MRTYLVICVACIWVCTYVHTRTHAYITRTPTHAHTHIVRVLNVWGQKVTHRTERVDKEYLVREKYE